MKKRMVFWMALCLICLLAPTFAQADDAGVLAEAELVGWIDQLLLDTRDRQPLNAPVGEEALTEDGYAFLYDFATLYYDKPVLDENSVLQAVVITGENYVGPRGFMLGSGEDRLISTFGWQNPTLQGDGAFAAFYCMNELPRAAYWSWAQHDENKQLLALQCAMHVQVGENAYTDAGMRFELEDGCITAIRIYGLNRFITLSDVQANLNAVMGVQKGEGWTPEAVVEPVEGYAVVNDAAAFSADDLTFGGVVYGEVKPEDFAHVLGEAQSTRVQDDAGAWLRTDSYADGLVLTRIDRNDEWMYEVESLSVTTPLITGPRGICVGDSLDKALSLFRSDGEGRTLNGMYAILYGDGVNAPYGLMEYSGDVTALSYTMVMPVQDQNRNITLHMAFVDDALQEWMLYTW